MTVIQHRTFRLVDGADEAAFIAADAAFQEVAYQMPGIVRRTLARGDGGEWLVETLWWSAEHADAAGPPSADLLAMVDDDSMQVRRYETLPG